jgi:pyruvate,water dikinase
MYAFINVGILKKQLGEEANAIIANISNLESMRPIQEMIRLTYAKGKIPPEEYKIRYNNYLSKFGDRNVEELKLESKTFRTNPELLKTKIEEYRQNPKQLEKLYESVMHPKQKDLSGLNRITKAQLRRCETGIRNREISRLNRSRIFGMVRDIFNHIAELLAKDGAITNKNDIYYLRIEEIERYINQAYDLKPIIAKRKAEYKIYRQLPAYSKLIFAEKEFNKLPTNINSHPQELSDKNLRGTGCSEGRATAKVVVVNSADQQDTQGKILVTRSTDPGWVFMLSTAKGVISERGSLLSHTAIISRELGVPAVVGVKDVTKILKTGDLVTIDGHTGEIIVEKEK